MQSLTCLHDTASCRSAGPQPEPSAAAGIAAHRAAAAPWPEPRPCGRLRHPTCGVDGSGPRSNRDRPEMPQDPTDAPDTALQPPQGRQIPATYDETLPRRPRSHGRRTVVRPRSARGLLCTNVHKRHDHGPANARKWPKHAILGPGGPRIGVCGWGLQDSNLWPPACRAGALTN